MSRHDNSSGQLSDSCSCVENESVCQDYSRTLFANNVHDNCSYIKNRLKADTGGRWWNRRTVDRRSHPFKNKITKTSSCFKCVAFTALRQFIAFLRAFNVRLPGSFNYIFLAEMKKVRVLLTMSVGQSGRPSPSPSAVRTSKCCWSRKQLLATRNVHRSPRTNV